MATFKSWCTPAYVYFIISVIFMIVVALQNYYSYDNKIYCIGMYSCEVDNIIIVFVLKLIYIMFWTWILNMTCHFISPAVSWVLITFPLLLMLILIRNLLVSN